MYALPSQRWYPEIHTCSRLGGGPRLSTTTRGGAMRTRTSADAVKIMAPAKTNPINRFRTITLLSVLLQRTYVAARKPYCIIVPLFDSG
jgi:hypothetical protein